ncbi:RraA family protein [Opitutus terrae]|uniref:Putative 4-hydroxy-4-methyl-2-oxoglutarate aldolase n=1 Tax=Opitutus terrae (strain DSM 11246 / JCM 15787 / PB90-1) TaxID=452637 RepID=B1ZYY2_OPITP|nr:demethylmenaquinone methyltransferase-like protein [Opitutus terrae]ACB76305.1 Demethylmenaquinone methyltransferase-like protein [Opitutus terrae PB90-1]
MITSKIIPHLIGCSAGLVLATSALGAAEAATPETLRAGKNFIATQVYPATEDAKILQAFEGLRVADVTDGLDAVGLFGRGMMDHEIRPVYRDTVDYSHRFIGIAVTARYVPTQQPAPGLMPEADYDAWAGKWYNERSSEPFMELIRPGTALILEDAPNADVGSIGSANIMAWKSKGCVGVVTNATARDTDEVITEKIPLYVRAMGRGIRPGRNEIESVNRPVVVGGVLVMPGDVVVGDGDGVVVVPRAQALKVAAYAHKILAGDKDARRGLYKQLGLPEDKSVK